MFLNRNEFLEAINFLLPAISENEVDGSLCYLRVDVDSEKAVFTAATNYLIKRATLLRPITVDELIDIYGDGIEKNEINQFLIYRENLKVFQTLLMEHKRRFNVLAKKDMSHTLIEIKPNLLISADTEIPQHKTEIELNFPELSTVIENKKKAVSGGNGYSALTLGNALKGFDKTIPLKFMYLADETGEPITTYITQPEQNLEAWVLQIDCI